MQVDAVELYSQFQFILSTAKISFNYDAKTLVKQTGLICQGAELKQSQVLSLRNASCQLKMAADNVAAIIETAKPFHYYELEMNAHENVFKGILENIENEFKRTLEALKCDESSTKDQRKKFKSYSHLASFVLGTLKSHHPRIIK
jgi:hypothetical protein